MYFKRISIGFHTFAMNFLFLNGKLDNRKSRKISIKHFHRIQCFIKLATKEIF